VPPMMAESAKSPFDSPDLIKLDGLTTRHRLRPVVHQQRDLARYE